MSELEETFALHCSIEKIPFIREFVFAKPRKWRADFYFEEANLIVEIEGGTFSNGRHNRPLGFEADLEKYNQATLLGYRVLRFSGKMVKNGEALKITIQALGEE